MDDSQLPVRSRDRRGLPHRGKPMKVKVYTSSGIKVAVWIVPSTALAGLLHEKVAKLYMVNPGRVSLVLMQKGGGRILPYGKGLGHRAADSGNPALARTCAHGLGQ